MALPHAPTSRWLPQFTLPGTLPLALAWFVLLSATSTAATHILPDGEIHRNVQVVLRPDGVTVEIEVGMNDDTLKTLAQAQFPDEDWNLEPAQLTAKFTQVAAQSICEQVGLSINGKPIELTVDQQELSAKHHQTARFVLAASVKWPERSALVLSDSNWLEATGQARVALKGKGVQVADSNAALLIVRAQPIELNELAEDERAEMLTIRAIVKP